MHKQPALKMSPTTYIALWGSLLAALRGALLSKLWLYAYLSLIVSDDISHTNSFFWSMLSTFSSDTMLRTPTNAVANATIKTNKSTSLENTQSDFFVAYGTKQRFPIGNDGRHGKQCDTRAADKQNNICFPRRLFDMLNEIDGQCEAARFSSIISWHKTGMGFVIHKPEEFVRTAMPIFFRSQSKFTSFQRQLNNYGFQRIQDRKENGSLTYYHKLFLRDQPALCRTIVLRSKILKKTQVTRPTSINSLNRQEERMALLFKNMSRPHLPSNGMSRSTNNVTFSIPIVASGGPLMVEGDAILDEAVEEICGLFDSESRETSPLYDVLSPGDNKYYHSTDDGVWDPDVESLDALEEL